MWYLQLLIQDQKVIALPQKKNTITKKNKNNSGGNSGDGGNGMVVGSQFLFKLFNTLYLNVTKRNVA